ncbi:MAG: trimethylamine methyltransferase family protein [Hyphomicrobiaceae bacterium]
MPKPAKAGNRQAKGRPTKGSARAGGRAARREARLRPGDDAPNAAPPGQVGGQYRPLTDAGCAKIHDAALTLLDTIGMGEVPPIVFELAKARGCHRDRHGRLTFPRAFVEDVIDGAAKSFVLHGQIPARDFEIKSKQVRYGTGGAAVQTLDLDKGRYRSSTLNDLYDFARLVDRLDNIVWFTRCCVATDVEDILDFDINTAYAIAAGTTKHVGTSFTLGEHVAPTVEMFDAMLGGDGAFAKRPFCKVHISPVVSPMRYGEDAVSVTEAAVRHNMPVNSIIAAQSGATAPAPLAGMLAQTVAETLAGLIMVNLFKPGHPTIFSNWPFVIDLRTGAFSGGGGEIAVLNAAAAQMGNYYDLPSGVAASMADSKLADAQAGFEKGITALATGLAGANMVYESAGMMGALLGASFESFVIDNEMLSSVQRVIRGIEVDDDMLGLDAIEAAIRGPGHFLGSEQTLAAMQRDYVYPKLSDRESPTTWQEQGARDMRERARDTAREILAEHFPNHLSGAVDEKIRSRFNILLPRQRMRRN